MKHQFALAAAAITLLATAMYGQDQPQKVDARVTRTFVLQNVTSNNEANEVITTARVIVAPEVRMFLAPSSNSLVVRGTPEELEQVAKIVSDLDRPKKTYRVTYTITEFDAGKKIGLQHYTLTFADGQRVVLKDGSRVPYSNGMNQFSVHDVGLNLDATLNASPGVIQLKSKVERTSVAEDKVAGNSTSPVTRQRNSKARSSCDWVSQQSLVPSISRRVPGTSKWKLSSKE